MGKCFGSGHVPARRKRLCASGDEQHVLLCRLTNYRTISLKIFLLRLPVAIRN